MKYSTITINIHEQVASVELNRPDVRNAMNAVMIQEITDVFSDLHKNPNVRIVVLSGKGNSFCAGVDLENMRDLGKMDWHENVAAGTRLEEMYKTVDHCSKPIIGKVHGHAYGGGFGLCTVCDIIVAAEDTSFCLSEVLIGIIPAVIGPFSINKIGNSYFRALGISGEQFDGNYAEKIGLIHYAVHQNEMEEVTSNIIKQVRKASPQAISRFKEYCRNMDSTNSAELIAELRASEEGQEGLIAFLEKRPPLWAK
ncbi:MAG TPA: enoyl-CoA hydratase-related protein [Candidatus Marinimicrobia bacterium]|jgi:methylglutaconyl-CoA hydratase|nr:enoyl-CoA hydratase-related protein [Candidatus Neomarinimicrobiota bacterium]MDP7217615.1 enoyl-CoA hydratase-related protein [Candidatus Neomarinimicrobiota bacterium]HBN45513.1 enoyl-CoA hydratase [Candidatus Neomarinimicrobiota bacterium]HJL75282.1 enoyl-CoA hydratase-related protein [Candidatus Neomarinimicrobiota bacterium]HJM70411.1 enoyl-CoA hydratase-related protein [Candidatus Neomarinimicrobiota bacterium]|tara:strand:+ start:4144 stop:4905 length:762 start_codon:yes stop_codon:yes gene_type:complete